MKIILTRFSDVAEGIFAENTSKYTSDRQKCVTFDYESKLKSALLLHGEGGGGGTLEKVEERGEGKSAQRRMVSVGKVCTAKFERTPFWARKDLTFFSSFYLSESRTF
jgi:hypothetical protein